MDELKWVVGATYRGFKGHLYTCTQVNDTSDKTYHLFGIIGDDGKLKPTTDSTMPALYRSERAAIAFNSRRLEPGKVVPVDLVVKQWEPESVA